MQRDEETMDLKAFRNFRSDRLDAAENLFFARELETILGETYDIKYPALKARGFLPVSYEAGPGTRKITYRAFTLVGKAKVIAAYGDDLPRADAYGNEYTSNVADYGIAIGYSIQEIRAAQKAGRPLEAYKMAAARRGWETLLDDIAFSGDSAENVIGMMNIPGANTYTVPNGGSGTAFSTKTAIQILTDLFQMERTPVNNTSGVEYADTLILPENQFGYISVTPVSSTVNTNTTILQYFLQNSRFIKTVEPWWRLAGAGSGATDRMMSYRKSMDALRLEIPAELEFIPPQARNLEFVIDSIASCGGVICPYPMSVTYGDGI
jgi:hypothetical protein